MTEVLYDIRLTQSIYVNDPQFKSDEMKDALVAGVLRKHKITQAELDSSLLWYSDNIRYYSAINDTVAARLKSRNESLMRSRTATGTNRRQTNQIIPGFYYLNEYTPTLSFNIDSLKIKSIKNISFFHLKFDVQGLSAQQKAEASIYFNYKDTLVRRKMPVERNTHYSFSKPSLPDSLLKSISGYIHLKDDINNISSNVLIYNISYIDSLAVSPRGADSPNRTKTTSDAVKKPATSTPSNTEEAKKEQPKDEVKTVKDKDSGMEMPVISKEKAEKSPLRKNTPPSK
ncbi:DUF4296 domain-containing protein [Dysgonomonas sp. 521]|uniref:DUF4296 domain-containing protein n=1 Tax=Dysgonomonas sp. 521 TaxID=2302932 RepID=UPI00351AF3CE